MRARRVCLCAVGAVAALAVVCGCGAQNPPAVNLTAALTTQQCVQDVFAVLAAMIDKPYDDQPFAEFVARYGTASPAYTAYRDGFTAFYGEAVAHGVAGAERKLLAGVTKDCSAS
jgi:hypothetical protein